MRLDAKRFAFICWSGIAAVACACAVGDAVYGQTPRGSNVAPALARLAAHSAGSAPLHVIVQGPAAGSAAASLGRIDKRLGHDGVAATVRADRLGRLASLPGVSLVAPDARIAFTAGSVSTANLATFFPGRDSASNPWNAGVT